MNDLGKIEHNINDINDIDNDLFNSDTKERFLMTISQNTRNSYKRILNISNKFERALNKDLNKFTLKEMETVLYSFKSSSRNTIESYGRIISSYLNWSVNNGLTSSNVLKELNPTDFEKYIVDKFEYLTERSLMRYENLCENYQDAVILRLLFIGANGKEASELRNLKKSDIDFENKVIKLTETLEYGEDNIPLKFTERFLNVDEYTLKLIRGAINQKVYMKRNGELNQTENNNIRPYTDLAENDYVIRPSITRTDTINTPVDKFVIYRRLKMISEILGASNNLTVKYLEKSGMINYASEIVDKESESISTIDLKLIADRFNVKSHHNLKGFITMENIKKYLEKDD